MNDDQVTDLLNTIHVSMLVDALFRRADTLVESERDHDLLKLARVHLDDNSRCTALRFDQRPEPR